MNEQYRMPDASRGIAVVAGLLASPQWGPLTLVNPADADTWTFRRTDLGHGITVVTSFNPMRFAPAWGIRGPAHHFESLVIADSVRFGGDSLTYATEAEAIDGHAVMVARQKSLLEARGLLVLGGAA